MINKQIYGLTINTEILKLLLLYFAYFDTFISLSSLNTHELLVF